MARKSRSDWLDDGLLVLAEQGEIGLVIDNLTKRLGVTKGSFYHHFRSREDYSIALLQHWEQQMTQQVIELNQEKNTPAQKAGNLTQLTTRLENRELEVAIRAWALRDPMAHEFQLRVDASRRAYTIELARGVMGKTMAADRLGTLVFALYVGAQQVLPPIQDDNLRDLFSDITDAFQLSKEEP